MLKVSDIIKIKIDKIVFGGEGLGYFNDFAIFVPMSVPEDELEVEIISISSSSSGIDIGTKTAKPS